MTHTLHVISGLGVGGAETMLRQVAVALHRRGMSQHVATLTAGGAGVPRLRRDGVAVTELPLAGLWSAPAALLALRRLVAETRPRTVLGWMYHGNVMAALAHRLSPGRAERRLVWNIRAGVLDLSRHGNILRLSAWLSSWPDLIVANSRAGAAFHLSHGFRPRLLEVIANGIDTERFKPDAAVRAQLRSELGIDQDAPLAIHVARLDPMKDHPGFLAAMAELPALSALMVGAGTADLPAPANVRALGERADLERLYACADIVVSTSAYAEGFSNVLAEGMSCGLVPVATDAGDARLIVADTGPVIPPYDRAALVSALSVEANRTAAERAVRGRLARERIVENFTLPMAVDAFARVCSDGC